jgi:hypothetical protein
MKDLFARLIAYLFVGSFCVAGPLCLVIALGVAGQRAALIYSGLRAEGTVVAKQSSGSRHATYAPVFQFTASDGRTYVVSSDVSGPEPAFRQGQLVAVLYHQSHPEAARIDAFGQLWTLPLVVGVVGAAFSIVPALALASWLRRRRTGDGQSDNTEPAQAASESGSRALKRVLGVLLTVGGLVLLAVGVGVVSSDSSSVHDSRVLVTSLGVLLTASGLAVGQWVATGSRLYHGLGGLVVTSMAVMFGWIALYGDSAGFSGGVSIGGASMTSSGSVTPARVAFGLASIGLGLVSLWAWKQVFRTSANPSSE